MNTRLLGTVFIIATLVVIADGLRSGGELDRLSALAYSIWGIGGVCAIVGLIKLNALGSNTVARALGLLPLIGFAAFTVGDGLRLAGFITAEDSLFFVLAGLAWISMLAGMLLVGILTIAAKTWRGWRRFVPLLTIVLAFAGMGLGSFVGEDIGAAIGYSAFLLLGYVIATAEQPAALPQSAVA
ncbi:MAG: hypothetical protein M3220_19170 [Chloroflexota bacterium]|nr:hypothetical protein [Chloroflexota bacterium]